MKVSELAVVICALLLPVAGVAQVHASEAPAPAPSRTAPGLSAPMDRTGQVAAPAESGTGQGDFVEARIFHLQQISPSTGANGSKSFRIAHGVLPTGESVGVHASVQPAGAVPSPLHTIRHSEIVCVQSGEITFDHVDAAGKTVSEEARPGDILYVAAGTSHRLRNTGSGPASYTVVAIGGDAK